MVRLRLRVLGLCRALIERADVSWWARAPRRRRCANMGCTTALSTALWKARARAMAPLRHTQLTLSHERLTSHPPAHASSSACMRCRTSSLILCRLTRRTRATHPLVDCIGTVQEYCTHTLTPLLQRTQTPALHTQLTAQRRWETYGMKSRTR